MLLGICSPVGLNGGVNKTGMFLGLDAPPVHGVPGKHFAILRARDNVVGVGAGRGLRDALNGCRVADEQMPWGQGPLACRFDLPENDLAVRGARD